MALLLVDGEHALVLPVGEHGHVGVGVLHGEIGGLVVGVLNHAGVALAVGGEVVDGAVVLIGDAVDALLALYGLERHLLVVVGTIERILQRQLLAVQAGVDGEVVLGVEENGGIAGGAILGIFHGAVLPVLAIASLLIRLGVEQGGRLAALEVAEHPTGVLAAEQVGVALDDLVDLVGCGLQGEVAVGSVEVLIHVDGAVGTERHGAIAGNVEELEDALADLLDDKLLVGTGELGIPLQEAPCLLGRGSHVEAHVVMGIVESIDAVGWRHWHNHPVLSLGREINGIGREVRVVCALVTIRHGLAVRLAHDAIDNARVVDVDRLREAGHHSQQDHYQRSAQKPELFHVEKVTVV